MGSAGANEHWVATIEFNQTWRHPARLDRPGRRRARRGRPGRRLHPNLIDSTIRELERLPQAERQGAMVVVAEMQTIPGVEFASMLSELGKHGASFLFATRSMSKLTRSRRRYATRCWPRSAAWPCSRSPAQTHVS
ncbi:MAG: hypothetical protein OXD50_11300 [Chloroflexi bacterium]|nr:hypothetical protein [Chloroflexota bacterium]